MNQTLINLALTLTANEFLHNIMEIMSIREKVKRLQTYMAKKPYKELPINIDTRPKSYAISTVAFIAVVGVLFGIFSWIDIEQTLAIKLIIGMLVASYFATAVLADLYHVDIEKVTRKFKK